MSSIAGLQLLARLQRRRNEAQTLRSLFARRMMDQWAEDLNSARQLGG